METQLRSFESLDAWQVCRDLRVQMAILARTFPNEEKYRLADQVIRASRSATANLAEGYGRFHYSDSAQFARHARGSLYEFLDHLTVARDERIIDQERFQKVRADVARAIAVINGYIRHTKNSKVWAAKPRITNNE